MVFTFKCPLCSAPNSAEPKKITDSMDCSSCKKSINVPNPNNKDASNISIKPPAPIEDTKKNSSKSDSQNKDKTLNFPCPKCKKYISALPKEIGDSITCEMCKHKFSVPNLNKIEEMKKEAEEKKEETTEKSTDLNKNEISESKEREKEKEMIRDMTNKAIALKKKKLKVFSYILAIVLNLIVFIIWHLDIVPKIFNFFKT